MPVLHVWHARSVALFLFAVALLAAVRAEEVVVDLGEITTNQVNSYGETVLPSYTVYFGCVTQPGMTWNVTGYPYNQWPLYVVSGLNKQTFQAAMGSPTALGVSFSGPFNSTFQEKQATVLAGAAMWRTGQLQDTHGITVRVKAKIRYQAGGLGHNQKKPVVNLVLSMKEGGPAAGKIRVPQPAGGSTEEPLPDEKYNVASNYPAYVTGEDGRVYEGSPPSYNLAGETRNWGTGANWKQVVVPGGTETSSWAPAGAISFTVGDQKWVAFAQGQDFSGWTGTVNQGGDGSLVIDLNGSGYGQNYSFRFPPGYKPETIDGREEEEPEPIPQNVDPCFGLAVLDAGFGGNPPENPDDPDLPVVGPPAGGKAPGQVATPGLPGSGGGTGGAPGGSGNLPAPAPKPPSGDAGTLPGPRPPGYTPGGPLPDENGDMALATELANSTASSASAVQTAAGGIIGWANVTPTNFGVAGDWEIALPLAGHTYAMKIPTEHAPVVRTLLLLVVTGWFIAGCVKLLLS